MKPFFTIGFGNPSTISIPPVGLADWILEGDVVLRQCGRHVNVRGEPDQPVEDAVGSHQDAVQIGVFRDPLQFRDPADIFRVGADHVRLPAFR